MHKQELEPQQHTILLEENDKLYKNFIYSIKTEVSRKMYIKCLKYYMKFLNVTSLNELIVKPQKLIEADIKDYLVYLTTQKKISHSARKTYLAPISIRFRPKSHRKFRS